jgi:hypothetical protein
MEPSEVVTFSLRTTGEFGRYAEFWWWRGQTRKPECPRSTGRRSDGASEQDEEI